MLNVLFPFVNKNSTYVKTKMRALNKKRLKIELYSINISCNNTMKKIFFIPISFLFLMWLINVLQFGLHLDFGGLGIHPRDKTTLIGILTSPLIHGNWEHLSANTLPLLILGIVLFLTYDKFAGKVWLLNYLLTGLLVWLFARGNSYHIGASGIIYGLASFLLFSGFFRMDIKAIAVASGVAIFYGGMVWGIFPLQRGVSWESHLFGGLSGLMLAYLYRNTDKDTIMEQHEKEITDRKTYEDFLRK